MFEDLDTDNVIIHSISVLANDVINIEYSEKRHIHEWGAKTSTWAFDRKAVPQIELVQLLESADAVIDLVEIKSRQDSD